MKVKLLVLALLIPLSGGPLLAGNVEARARYRAPTGTDGMVFPVARSNWYSIISFSDDWHQPRLRRVDGRWRLVGYHEGNDIAAEPGTPVHAVLGGRVENSGWTFYSGWRLGIRGHDRRYWFYAHLNAAPALAPGARVETGDVIGAVGNTGYGDEPGHKDEFMAHLHLGIQEPDGRWINPYPLVKRLYRHAVRSR